MQGGAQRCAIEQSVIPPLYGQLRGVPVPKLVGAGGSQEEGSTEQAGRELSLETASVRGVKCAEIVALPCGSRMGQRCQRARGHSVPWVGGCGQTLTRRQRCDISDFHGGNHSDPNGGGTGCRKSRSTAKRGWSCARGTIPRRVLPSKRQSPPPRRLKVPAGHRAKGLKNTSPDTRSLKKPEAVLLSLFILFFHDGCGVFLLLFQHSAVLLSGSPWMDPSWAVPMPASAVPKSCPVEMGAGIMLGPQTDLWGLRRREIPTR